MNIKIQSTQYRTHKDKMTILKLLCILMLNIGMTETNECKEKITKGCSNQIRITISCEPKFQHPDAEGIYQIQSNIPIIYKHQSREVYIVKHEADGYWTVSYSKRGRNNLLRNGQCNTLCPNMCKTKWGYLDKYRNQMILQSGTITVESVLKANEANSHSTHTINLLIVSLVQIFLITQIH